MVLMNKGLMYTQTYNVHTYMYMYMLLYMYVIHSVHTVDGATLFYNSTGFIYGCEGLLHP